MKFIYLLCLALAVMNCTTENKKPEEIENETNPGQLTELVKEEFIPFFKRFSADSVFQRSRIAFPISYYTVDIEDNKKEYVYGKGELAFIGFSEDSAAATRKVDAYEPVIKENGDSNTTYIRMGIDNGIRIEYYFERDEKGEWYLVEVVNNSH